jgi:hypothetical protein
MMFDVYLGNRFFDTLYFNRSMSSLQVQQLIVDQYLFNIEDVIVIPICDCEANYA